MKAVSDDFLGRRGSLPPQLMRDIDMADIASQTAKFADDITCIAKDFLARLNASGYRDELHLMHSIPLPPAKLLGKDVRFEYVASGTVGSVYKTQIGGATFALKINRIPNAKHELIQLDASKKARNLINKSYIGSTFEYEGETYSWVLMDFVEKDFENSFDIAKEKLFYAAMTKGLKYYDLWTPGNTKNGRIVDIDGVTWKSVNLTRTEVDIVKKFMHLMRTDDMDGFKNLADSAIKNNPAVIKYMFEKMSSLQMQIPMRFQKFRKIIGDYNRQIPTQFIAPRMAGR